MLVAGYIVSLLLVLAIGFVFGWILGHRRGAIEILAKHDDYVRRIETLLRRSGVNLPGDEPLRLQESENPSRSWTGQAVPKSLLTDPGSIPRWDEPSSHR